MDPQVLADKIRGLGEGTQVEVLDLTGTQNHYRAVVISPLFDGKMTMQQHRMIYDLLKPEMDSGELHALTLKTMTPEEYSKETGES